MFFFRTLDTDIHDYATDSPNEKSTQTYMTMKDVMKASSEDLPQLGWTREAKRELFLIMQPIIEWQREKIKIIINNQRKKTEWLREQRLEAGMGSGMISE